MSDCYVYLVVNGKRRKVSPRTTMRGVAKRIGKLRAQGKRVEAYAVCEGMKPTRINGVRRRKRRK